MSRVGKMPVSLPQGVDVALKNDQINVKGGLGADARLTSDITSGEDRA